MNYYNSKKVFKETYMDIKTKTPLPSILYFLLLVCMSLYTHHRVISDVLIVVCKHAHNSTR